MAKVTPCPSTHVCP